MMRSNRWLPGATMSAAQGHRILDLVKSGVTVPDALIAAALVATGDLA
jgi:hypothetical protein